MTTAKPKVVIPRRKATARGPQQASANVDALADRRIKSLEMRLKGMTLRQIAEVVGVSIQIVSKDVKLMLMENLADVDIPRLRAMEEARLDKVLVVAMEIAEKKSADPELRLKAVDRVVRVSTQRATLLGLNSPVRHDVTVTERTQADVELEELINEAKVRNAGVIEKLRAEVGSNDAGS